MPISVLRYLLDEAQFLGLEFSLYRGVLQKTRPQKQF